MLGAFMVSDGRMAPLCLQVVLPLGQHGLLFMIAGSQESTFNGKEARSLVLISSGPRTSIASYPL